MTQYYLSRKEVAELLGITSDGMSRYKLPAPDVMIGTTRGWTAETILAWDANRPGQGTRTDLLRKKGSKISA